MPKVEATRATILLVDDDQLFAQTLSLNLEDEGFEVALAKDGETGLEMIAAGGDRYDVVLLDWRMPGIDGLAVLERMRADRYDTPVIFLTSLGDTIYEEAALSRGAVDFVEKNKSLGVIVRRLDLILSGAKTPRAAVSTAGADEPAPVDAVRSPGPIVLKPDIARAFWRDHELPLTVSEFKVVHLLVAREGDDVSYREIYDTVRGEGFRAGSGDDGYRTNVRATIRRIRQKFHAVDPDFTRLDTYAGFGYRWLHDEAG